MYSVVCIFGSQATSVIGKHCFIVVYKRDFLFFGVCCYASVEVFYLFGRIFDILVPSEFRSGECGGLYDFDFISFRYLYHRFFIAHGLSRIVFVRILGNIVRCGVDDN